jgi:aryl-alcohol dehydrogenase-like predicted oxidoreductase
VCVPPPRDTATAGDVAAALGYAELPNGVRMPRLGFGTAGLGCAKSYRAVRDALEAGYRHIDTAQAAEWWVYFPPFSAPSAKRSSCLMARLSSTSCWGLRYCEDAVGRALADSGVPREELFVTTKQVCSFLHHRSGASRRWLRS